MNLTFIYGRGFKVTIEPRVVAALIIPFVAYGSIEKLPLLVELVKAIAH